MKQETPNFQSVLRKLDTWANPTVENCERRSSRYSIRCQAELISDSEIDPDRPCEQIVHIRDISRTGAGLLSSVPIDTGSRWRLRPIVNDMVLADLPVFCRYSRKIDDSAYLIGVEFGIDAALMVALGVRTEDIRRDESSKSHEILKECRFVDPSVVINEGAA